MKKFVGIDVGLDGGIAVMDLDRNLELFTIPKIKTKVDLPALAAIFEGFRDNTYVCVEDVHSIFGSSAKGNFNFGRIAGILEALVVSQNFQAYQLVQPKVWQKEIWTNHDMIYKVAKTKKVDTKATSLLAAKRLFPRENFIATARSTKPHDGLFDAALIAEYCRLRYG